MNKNVKISAFEWDNLRPRRYQDAWTKIRNEMIRSSSDWNLPRSINGVPLTPEQFSDQVQNRVQQFLNEKILKPTSETAGLIEILIEDLLGLGPMSVFLNLDFPIHVWSSSEDLNIYYVKPEEHRSPSDVKKFPVPWASKEAMQSTMNRIAQKLNARIDELHTTVLRPWQGQHMIEMIQYPASMYLWIRLRPCDESEKTFYNI